MNKFNELMKIGKAAKLFGISVTGLRYWANTGKITCYKTPGSKFRLFHFKEIHDLLEQLNSSRSVKTDENRIEINAKKAMESTEEDK